MAIKPIGIDDAGNLPARARTKLAANFADSSTPEGSALELEIVKNAPTTMIADASMHGVGGFRGLRPAGVPDFLIYGINLGLTNTGTAASYDKFWTTDWDEQWVDDNIARIANLGANTIRITGQFTAYSRGAAAFKEKFEYVLAKSREHNLKVIYGFLNVGVPGEETIGTSTAQIDAYKAMISHLMEGHIADPSILLWDALQDGRFITDASHRAIAVALAPFIKSLDPTTLVTSSGVDIDASIHAEIVPVVDIIDVHYYVTPGSTGANLRQTPLERIRPFTNKPVIISEYGINSNASGYEPLSYGERAQAGLIAAGRKLLAQGDLIGIVIHKIIDPPFGANLFGLYRADGTPKLAAAEAALYPVVRTTAAKEYVDAAPTPVVVDNFGRANQTWPAGTDPSLSPLGGRPTTHFGRWGIVDSCLYLDNSGGPGTNQITWEANTRDATVEAEFSAETGTFVTALLARFVDSSNYLMVRAAATAAAPNSGALEVYSVVGGTATLVISTGNSINFGRYFHLSARVFGTTIIVFLNGRQILRATLPGGFFGTRFGVGLTPSAGDAGSRITRFRTLVDGRAY